MEREAEIGAIGKTAEIGAALAAFSPVARGFLADAVHSRADLPSGDLRRGMPRFSDENLPANLQVLAAFRSIAEGTGVTPTQLAIAWGLAKAPHIISIPRTTHIAHLGEDFAARSLVLDEAVIAAVDAVVNNDAVAGARYPEAVLGEIDTERFAA